jgi:hypothetical protein
MLVSAVGDHMALEKSVHEDCVYSYTKMYHLALILCEQSKIGVQHESTHEERPMQARPQIHVAERY